MPLKKKIRDIMVPVTNYATMNEDRPLKDVVLHLLKIHSELESGERAEAGNRTCLVLDSNLTLVGIIDFQSILKTLIPEIAGGIGDKLASLELSVAIREAGTTLMDDFNVSLTERALSRAEIRVGDMMLKVRGKGIQADSYLIEGLRTMHRLKVTVMPVYDGTRLVGVIRDSDLFLTVASIFKQ